jgi:hypothetical protein
VHPNLSPGYPERSAAPMSDNWIQLIPRDPLYVPPKTAQLRGQQLLEEFLPDAEEVNVEVTKHPRFFHPGQNWSGVRCCLCKSDLCDLFYREQFLDDRQFKNLLFKTPCCKKRVSMNDLHFIWPAGFSRFVLEAMNPNVQKLVNKRITALKRVLGCELRQLFLHL